jgi:hypothetical protein
VSERFVTMDVLWLRLFFYLGCLFTERFVLPDRWSSGHFVAPGVFNVSVLFPDGPTFIVNIHFVDSDFVTGCCVGCQLGP